MTTRRGILTRSLRPRGSMDLTVEELRFLSSQGLSPDDVLDVRGMHQRDWFLLIDQMDKTIALGQRCRAYGHRLRSRRGHCVQCDTAKLAYAARHRAQQYVYIAGSKENRRIKIGTAKNVAQRERQLRAENYGGASDWTILYYVRVEQAGAVERAARSKLSACIVHAQYRKNGSSQLAMEMLSCSYRTAERAILNALGDDRAQEYRSSQWRNYQFV